MAGQYPLSDIEKAALLGIRAREIERGDDIYVEYEPGMSALEIAELELEHRCIPVKIVRHCANGVKVIVSPNDCMIIDR